MKISDLFEKYTKDNTALLRHLKNKEFDAYSYWYEICTMLVNYQETEIIDELLKMAGPEYQDWDSEDLSPSDLLGLEPSLFYKLPKSDQENIAERVIDKLLQDDPANAPSSAYMGLNSESLLKRTTWLVHFSDNAEDIAREGFKYGVDQMDRLGLTTYMSHQEKEYGGYNFAFIADSREADFISRDNLIPKYGRDAVLFQNSGVRAWHNGDEEEQIIFYGKEVDPRGIVYLSEVDGDWIVNVHPTKYKRFGQNSKEGGVFKSTYKACVDWVQNNFDQYRKIITGY